MLVLVLSLSITLLDQASKYLVMSRLLPGQRVPLVAGFFQLRRIHNPGAAWGILAGFGPWLIVLSLIMLVLLVVYRRHILEDTLMHRIALGMMVAGIIGNLIDRIRLGYVVDFLDFYLYSRHFPAFNVADMAICTGVFLYVVSQVVASKREKNLHAA